MKHGPTTESGRRHQNIQRERALYVKALIAEGLSDDEIIRRLVVTPELAEMMFIYGRNY